MAVRRSLVLLTLFSLGLLPFLTFGSIAQQIQQESPARNLQLAVVERGDVELTISAIGEVEADEIANLSFTRSGTITELLVDEGDYALAGDVLAHQDNRIERIDYEQALLRLASAELDLQDLQDDPDERDIRVAEANIDRAWGVYSSIDGNITEDDIRAAELRLQQAQDALTSANEARQWAGGDDIDIALLDAEIGQAAFDSEIARLELDDLHTSNQADLNAAYTIVVQRQRELEQLMAGPEQWQFDQAQVRIEDARMDVDQAADNLNLLSVVAPFDGVISGVNIEQGEVVAPGMAALEITKIDPLKLTVEVDEIDIRQVRPGMEAVVELDALDDVDFPATVQQIALVGREEDGIISYDVDLTLQSDNPRIRVGMTAEASMIVESAADVLIIPNQYIRLDRRTGRAFVDLVDAEGVLTEHEIELGLQGQAVSEVVSGLSEGDTLALDLEGDRFSFFGGS
jgi:RND family efflux transporter MFP subunit